MALGVEADTGATVTLNGGSVTVSGPGSGDLFATGAGTKITASNIALTATGGTDPVTGYTSYGIDAESGASIVFTGGSITTSGASANGAQLLGSGSNVTLSGGTTILTTGNGAAGLVVIGSGATLTATGITVTTHGAVDSSDGFIAFGAYNGSSDFPPGYPAGGTLNLTDTTIITTGAGAIGVETNSGGVTNISGGSVSTAGQDAHALFVTGAGSTANLSGATAFTTQGAGAIGIYATLGGVVTATSGAVTIATSGGVSPATGLGAYGVNADGAGIADQPRSSDDHDHRGRRDRALRQRRRRKRRGGHDHRDRNAQCEDDQRLGGRGWAAGQRRIGARDRRRLDRLGGNGDRLHGRDEPDRNLR